jgi:hypothetical protein
VSQDRAIVDIRRHLYPTDTLLITLDAFETKLFFAKQEECERIIKVLEGIAIETPMGEVAIMELLSAITKLIRGEQNE